MNQVIELSFETPFWHGYKEHSEHITLFICLLVYSAVVFIKL